MGIIFLALKWDNNQLNWVTIYLFIMFISYEGHRFIIENKWDNNLKLMRCFDNLKHEVESCYIGIMMHNYMIWLAYALIFYEMKQTGDEIIMVIDECHESCWLISW